jgi:hypothetical protein
MESEFLEYKTDCLCADLPRVFWRILGGMIDTKAFRLSFHISRQGCSAYIITLFSPIQKFTLPQPLLSAHVLW